MGKEQLYESRLSSDVMVPMRDGTRLATDIYYPAKDGDPILKPLPTILGRTSYDKTWQELWIEPVANFFTHRVYLFCDPNKHAISETTYKNSKHIIFKSLG